VKSIPSELCDEFVKLKIVANTEVVEMEVGSSLLQEICRGQVEDEKIQEIKHNIKKEKSPRFSEDECDRTTSEMRGLSPKIISEDSR
jgi:hypothetical protein